MQRLAEQLKKMAKDGEQPKMTREQAERMRQRAQNLLDRATPEQRQELERLARDLADQSPQNQDGQPPTPDRPSDQRADRPDPQSSPQPGRPQALRDQQARREPQPDGDQQSTQDQEPVKSPQSARDQQTPRDPQPNRDQASRPGDATNPPATRSGAPGSQASRNPRGPQQAPTNADPVDIRPRPDPAQGERVIADYFNPRQGPRTGTATSSTLQEGVREAASGVERAIEQQAVPNQYSDLVRRVFRRYVDRVQPGAAPPPPAPLEDAPDLRPRSP
jgi:hypothetical protein